MSSGRPGTGCRCFDTGGRLQMFRGADIAGSVCVTDFEALRLVKTAARCGGEKDPNEWHGFFTMAF